jgi:type I restriction enzyme S subunit
MWKTKSLKDLCSIFTDGDWIEKKDQSVDVIRLVQTGNIKVGYFAERQDKARYISEDTFNRLNCTEVKRGDILVSRLPDPVGRASIIPELKDKAITAVDCTIIRLKEEILPTYLNYYMQSPQYLSSIQLKVTGATRQRISRKNLGEISITFPPLPEQERIVAKLDAAFAEIDSAIDMSTVKENEVKKLDRFLLENLFKENFDIKKIGDLGNVKSGGTPKSTEQSYWNGEIDWYSSGELNNMYASQTAKHITNKGLSNSNAKIFPKGSLLVGMYDTAAMKMSILQKEATFNQAIVGIPPNEFALPEYLFYALNFLKPKILLERRGVRQQNLSLAKIKNIDIPIPSMEQQQYIVSQANIAAQKTESILKTLSSKKAQFGILKSAILAQELQPSEAA